MKLKLDKACHAIRKFTELKPSIGLVFGSGLGNIAETIKNPVFIPYHEIPEWPLSTVHGHDGRLVIGELEGQTVVAQQGRAHFFEGYSMQQITFPMRVMGSLGIKTVILTNAAGSCDHNYRKGDIMMLNDHINFPGMVGNNPLMGANDDSIGPRFLGLAQTYDKELRKKARAIAISNKIPLREGIYAALSGPHYETPAEIRMLKLIGANAVGMSTVHEVLVARHMGIRVMAFSGITDMAPDDVDTESESNHEEVIETGKILVPRFSTLLRALIKEIHL